MATLLSLSPSLSEMMKSSAATAIRINFMLHMQSLYSIERLYVETLSEKVRRR